MQWFTIALDRVNLPPLGSAKFSLCFPGIFREKAERKRRQVASAHKKSDQAKMLKLADKTSNLRAIAFSPSPDWSVKRRLEYIDWAKSVVAGLRGVSPGSKSSSIAPPKMLNAP